MTSKSLQSCVRSQLKALLGLLFPKLFQGQHFQSGALHAPPSFYKGFDRVKYELKFSRTVEKRSVQDFTIHRHLQKSLISSMSFESQIPCD
jgi:hypothetical protein